MFAVNHRELSQMHRSLGADATVRQIAEWLEVGRSGEPGGLRPQDFDLYQLATAFVGREWVDAIDPRNSVNAMETGDAVDTTAFFGVSGQIYYNSYLQGYERPEFVFSRLTPVETTNLKDGEKIAGVTDLEDDMDDHIHEGMPYPNAGYGEDYIETPALQKKGKIMGLTREHIVFRQTNRFIKDGSALGELDGLRLEKTLVDHYIGKINSYSRLGTAYNTYLTSGGWVNDHENPFADYNSVDASRQLMLDMKDPNTGESIIARAGVIVCTPARGFKVRSIINATEVKRGDGASGGLQTTFPNPIAGMVTAYESQHMYDRIQSQLSVSAANAKEWWLHFDPSKFIVIMEGWPMTLSMEGPNSTASFERDILQRYKVSSMRIPAIKEPRVSVRNKHTS